MNGLMHRSMSGRLSIAFSTKCSLDTSVPTLYSYLVVESKALPSCSIIGSGFDRCKLGPVSAKTLIIRP